MNQSNFRITLSILIKFTLLVFCLVITKPKLISQSIQITKENHTFWGVTKDTQNELNQNDYSILTSEPHNVYKQEYHPQFRYVVYQNLGFVLVMHKNALKKNATFRDIAMIGLVCSEYGLSKMDVKGKLKMNHFFSDTITMYGVKIPPQVDHNVLKDNSSLNKYMGVWTNYYLLYNFDTFTISLFFDDNRKLCFINIIP